MPHHALYDPVRREAILEVRPVVSCRETSMLEDPTLLDDETKKEGMGLLNEQALTTSSGSEWLVAGSHS